MPVSHVAFLTPGNYPEADPLAGLEATLQLFAFGEELGFDSAWVRQRHLERGVSSAATFLAAASQRTRRIMLGTAVIQMGYENPFRLAEDLATADLLSRGRLNVGLSAGPPAYADLLGSRFLDGAVDAVDYSHNRLLRLRDNIVAEPIGGEDVVVLSPAGPQRARLHPRAPGLAERLWYGGGSLGSAEWAGRNGFNLLIGNIVRGEKTDDFSEAQLAQLDVFLAGWTAPRPPRIALGRVVIPLDGADESARRRYRAYADSRQARTRSPQGERRTLFADDVVGMSDDILEKLRRAPVLPRVDEFRLELPYDFTEAEYRQILSDFVTWIAPELGWRPASLSAA
ncbi:MULTISPECIES: LLM class flavin-dependent oxidoreductase [Chelatococcus]|uniref:Alkanesulfonate monooxygenase SsuD/methylene tetrahydromethanopterin reductase-like flavin-dependent oxidoreductase (Luciferase family) n=1 Tax=Chelatococcus caeni TaxID=1348468 RepID=A0A840BVJ7_9HYPH|nr:MULTISPECIES: LLM class flavin-dependent oxidoreductase [Chelatococcus]ALA18593.1 oxidoreductase [Chelatococcus sp. CO-6]MBB4015722.1 alkanesulfonate monooxygenase SsuD/methylene tetrahydromethanopterin reductase-like flavin-dependent oxidoreductase (luciferase family) [Chelatococcus caeni]